MTLKGPIRHPEIDGAVIFEADNPARTVYVRLLTGPTLYPIFIFFEGEMDRPGYVANRPHIPSLGQRHPALQEAVDLYDKTPGGWWTANLGKMGAALAMSPNSFAPRFPANTRTLGQAIVRRVNLLFEDGLGRMDRATHSAQYFHTHVVGFLQTGETQQLEEAADELDRVRDRGSADLIRHCEEVNDLLGRAGFDRVGRNHVS